jgi:hypothetical protein
VERWLLQFDKDQQLPFLREFSHVIGKTFLTEQYFSQLFSGLVTLEQLTGKDPTGYWKRAHVLDIQKDGESQSSMRALLARSLANTLGIDIHSCGSESEGGEFIYLDDVIFTGGRIYTDLDPWIRESAPKDARIHIIVAALHTLGQYQLESKLSKSVHDSGKKITIKYWCTPTKVENRKAMRNDSGVLWPTMIPAGPPADYVATEQKYPFVPRVAGGALAPFSSEAGRAVLEQEFLRTGVYIRSLSQNPSSVNRPLGHGFYGIGFGANIVTYRNCPNNCPLALWWGDPNATSGALHWYPLLQRKGYG